MGTSKSGTGPGSGVPMVPPWVPDPVAPGDDTPPSSPQSPDQQPQIAPAPRPVPLAPPRRFGPARSALGAFARDGFERDMRAGIGHYVRKGYGGAASATRRMGGTVRSAHALYRVLVAAATRHPADDDPFDPTILSGRSADDVMDALVEVVRPTDGTQDADASRAAVRNAMSELLDRFPDADLLDLTEAQRLYGIERFVALDTYNRLVLDLGKTIQDKAPTATAALSRLKDIKDYVKQTVSACFRALVSAGDDLSTRRISQLVHQTLGAAFQVFEDYVR